MAEEGEIEEETGGGGGGGGGRTAASNFEKNASENSSREIEKVKEDGGEEEEEEVEAKEGERYFGSLAKEGKAPPGTNPFASSSSAIDTAEDIKK